MTLKKWILAFLPMGMLFSCTRTEIDKLPVSAISTLELDTTFKEMVKDHLAHYANMKNASAIREAARDGVINDQEFREYWKYWGMSGPAELDRYYSLLRSRTAYLETRYHFSALPPEDRIRNILRQIRVEWGLEKDTLDTGRQLLDDDCEKRRVNCLVQVMSETLLMHISCAAMDATVFLGIACHATATIYQITASNSCNMDYQKCKKQSTVVD